MSGQKNEEPTPELTKAKRILFELAVVLCSAAAPANSPQAQAGPSGKPWQILDMSFPRPIVRMIFFSERQAHATCETMNTKAGQERFKVFRAV